MGELGYVINKTGILSVGVWARSTHRMIGRCLTTFIVMRYILMSSCFLEDNGVVTMIV